MNPSYVNVILFFIVLTFIAMIPTTNLSYEEKLEKGRINNEENNECSSIPTIHQSPMRNRGITDISDYSPGTNITLSEYLDGVFQDNYTSSITSENSSHWLVTCNYSRTHDYFGEPFSSPFDTIVSKSAINHTYLAEGYYNFNGLPQITFDFWIDTFDFSVGYSYKFGSTEFTVSGKDIIIMDGIGSFNAWKVIGQDQGVDFSSWYDQESGMLLASNFVFISTFWYNITKLEVNLVPTGNIISPIDSTVEDKVIVEWTSIDSPSYSVIQNVYICQETSRVLTVATGIKGNGTHLSYPVSTLNLPNGSDYYIELVISDFYTTTIINSSNQPFTIKHPPALITVTSPLDRGVLQSPVLLSYKFDPLVTTITSFYIDDVNQSTIPISGQTFDLLDDIHNFTLIARNNLGVYQNFVILFTVDTISPDLTIEGLNNQTYRTNTLVFQVTAKDINDIQNISYSLDDSDNITINRIDTYQITLKNITNGSHYLKVYATDVASNIQNHIVYFTIYTSTFGINWTLEPETPRSFTVKDFSSHYWFTLTLTSKSKQNFTISLVSKILFPNSGDDIDIIVRFQCDNPLDIIFMTLAVKKTNETNYQWLSWDNSSQLWEAIETYYNPVNTNYEATIIGHTVFFALQRTHEISTITSEQVSFYVSAFEIWGLILSFMALILTRKVNSRRRI